MEVLPEHQYPHPKNIIRQLPNDSSGGFGIDDLRPGDYQLTVVYLGYRSVPAFLRVQESVQTTVTLAMVRDPRLGPARVENVPPVTVSYELIRLP